MKPTLKYNLRSLNLREDIFNQRFFSPSKVLSNVKVAQEASRQGTRRGRSSRHQSKGEYQTCDVPLREKPPRASVRKQLQLNQRQTLGQHGRQGTMGSSFNQTELISYKSINIGNAPAVGIPATTEAKGSSTSQTKPQRTSYKQFALQGVVEIQPNLSEKNELIHAKEESLQELWPHPHPGHNEIEILNDIGDKSFLPSNQQTLGQAELNLLLDDYIE